MTNLGRSCSAAAPSFGPQVPEGIVEVELLQDDLRHQVLPAKKRTLWQLDNELSSPMEVRTGLHPYDATSSGVAGPALDAREGAEAQSERGGILVGPGMPGSVQKSHFGSTGPGGPGEPAEFQQVMSPTCGTDSLTFGIGSASSLVSREATSTKTQR